MLLDFDVREQQEMDRFTGGSIIIKSWSVKVKMS